ncbi:hydratase, partial [Salmonella enterica subsp. enterica serovar Typhimurium]
MLEMEVVFLVDQEVSPNDSVEDVMKKCRVAPGIEVPDGRYEDWFPNATLYEIVADAAVNGAVVIGRYQKASHDDLDNTTATLYLNGETVKKGPSTDVMEHPAKAVQWLAQALDSRGRSFKPGQFV